MAQIQDYEYLFQEATEQTVDIDLSKWRNKEWDWLHHDG